ncbi:MAG: aminoglycoside N(3)-acetyltransferase [Bacteroidetes bacterium]|nr:MAG: aminoglycoside N(3)-acetyltransferase [Bacteroidota bacterium]
MDHAALAHHICKDLVSLGLREGDTLLVHSSLRSMGQPTPNPEAVVSGLLAALGPQGTLLMPALSYEAVGRDQPYFDLEKTPSNVGSLPEYFRQRTGTQRSIHPTHSVCGVGERASEMLGLHQRDHSPVGLHSPFRLLPDYGGKILMLGCGLRPNTSFHGIEELFRPPYLLGEPYTVYMSTPEAQWSFLYTPHDFAGYVQRYDRLAEFLSPPALVRGQVLAAEAWLIDAAAMWEAGKQALEKDPFAFVEAEG